MATQDEKNLGGDGRTPETPSTEATEETKGSEKVHYTEDDHDVADWEHEGGNHGHVHDHAHHRREVEDAYRQIKERQAQANEEEKGANSGDGSVRDVTDTNGTPTPATTPQRLDQISPESQELLKVLATSIWNDGFALVGGVIPIKSDGQGGFVIDEARSHGTINNIGDKNAAQVARLLMWLAMQDAGAPDQAEVMFNQQERPAQS